jgi:hypothetical protein
LQNEAKIVANFLFVRFRSRAYWMLMRTCWQSDNGILAERTQGTVPACTFSTFRAVSVFAVGIAPSAVQNSPRDQT